MPLQSVSRVALPPSDYSESRMALAVDDLNEASCGVGAFFCAPWSILGAACREWVTMPRSGMDLDLFGARMVLLARDSLDLSARAKETTGCSLFQERPPTLDGPLDPDERLGDLERLYVPTSGAWNPFETDQEDYLQALRELESRSFRGRIRDGRLEAIARLRGEYFTLTFRAESRTRAGSGGRVILRTPERGSREAMAVLACRLNTAEAVDPLLPFPLDGAWRAWPAEDGPFALAYVSFLPSVFHEPGAVTRACRNQVLRLLWYERGQSDGN